MKIIIIIKGNYTKFSGRDGKEWGFDTSATQFDCAHHKISGHPICCASFPLLRKLRLYRQSPLRKLCNTIGQSLKTFKGKRTLKNKRASDELCRSGMGSGKQSYFLFSILYSRITAYSILYSLFKKED